MHAGHYGRLLWMAALSFAAMYALMYAMVNVFANVYMSFNQVYMAGLMTAAMVVIELAIMGRMYANAKLNAAIVAISVIALLVFWMLIREQTAISDKQFLRSMIPHHAGAILMCEQSPIRDDEIRKLCGTIIVGQQAEIDQMKRALSRLSG